MGGYFKYLVQTFNYIFHECLRKNMINGSNNTNFSWDCILNVLWKVWIGSKVFNHLTISFKKVFQYNFNLVLYRFFFLDSLYAFFTIWLILITFLSINKTSLDEKRYTNSFNVQKRYDIYFINSFNLIIVITY